MVGRETIQHLLDDHKHTEVKITPFLLDISSLIHFRACTGVLQATENKTFRLKFG